MIEQFVTSDNLLAQFAVSTVMVVLCVFVHGLGLFGLNRAVRTETAVERLEHTNPLSPRGVLFTLAAVIAMLALHGVQIWIFAFTYLALGAIPDLESALYFSTSAIRRWGTTIPTCCRNGGCWARSKACWASSCSAGRPRSSSA